jgi:Polyketide cyclase / dehydrase and lipid transport
VTSPAWQDDSFTSGRETIVQGYVLCVERMIPVSPAIIFDVLSDATKHSMIDGSGMLQGKRPEAPQRLVLGTTFGMSMKMLRFPYSTVNKVVEFDADRRIAWQTGPTGAMGRVLAGRIWRYELEPADGGTLVRESWDITPDHQRVLLKLGGIYSGKTRRDMERTLERLDRLVSGDQEAGPPR